jgi:membrane-associated HD superfamily phosphohydrolase
MLLNNLKLTHIFKIIKSKINKINIIPEFARKIAFQRWTIAILLSSILALLLLPQIHFSYPEYKVGSIAIRDVRADRDLLVEDKVATEQKKIGVARDVQAVYDYDSDTVFLLKTNLAKAFL